MASVERRAVLVDGCRIPFQKSGQGYKDLIAYDLGRMAVKGLIHKTQLRGDEVSCVIMGTVVSEVTTSNVAREILLGASLPQKIPAYTVTQACISANRAITNGVDLIRAGKADVVIAGGTDTVSDPPIRFPKSFRKKLVGAQRLKSFWEYVKFFFSFRPSDFYPEIPNIAEFSLGLTMGQSGDRLAGRLAISRQDQDEYALRSHLLAAKAYEEGHLQKEVYPVRLPPSFKTIDKDNTFRSDVSLDKLSKLRPAFVKKYGTLTAGNSSPLTDGASAVLLMAEEVALALGYTPKALISDYVYTAHDPLEELLLGPAYSIPALLDQNDLSLKNIEVFELHEAFAGQVLSCLKCLDSELFAQENLGKNQKVGELPLDKLNNWGGSLSLGHPFGATGGRLITTAVNRLCQEDGRFAIVAGCAAGAQSNAILLERYKN